MPFASLPFALTSTTPLTVEFGCGLVTEAVGATESTRSVTEPEDELWLPAVSTVAALTVHVPSTQTVEATDQLVPAFKRALASGITSDRIDHLYTTARAHGALGGKITGAGGGGFLLLYAPPDVHPRICRALPDLRPVPLRFEPQGAKIIYVEETDCD